MKLMSISLNTSSIMPQMFFFIPNRIYSRVSRHEWITCTQFVPFYSMVRADSNPAHPSCRGRLLSRKGLHSSLVTILCNRPMQKNCIWKYLCVSWGMNKTLWLKNGRQKDFVKKMQVCSWLTYFPSHLIYKSEPTVFF